MRTAVSESSTAVLTRAEKRFSRMLYLPEKGRFKTNWKREFKLPWRKAGLHLDDSVDSDQWVVNEELSFLYLPEKRFRMTPSL